MVSDTPVIFPWLSVNFLTFQCLVFQKVDSHLFGDFGKPEKNYRCASVFQRKIVYFDFENMRVMHSKLRGYYFDRVTGNLRILQTWNSITLKLVILVWDVQIVILFRFGFSSVFEEKKLGFSSK